ncbi:D-glycero-alpha-D-manno-heptose 1-phosphate guanylyltransferase [bacterium BMS3Bbin08]|nr:D-glycero-alpha-D-manno-heptose 1-phosphate guanylyltransferase [bacterium BMS3Bbin08]
MDKLNIFILAAGLGERLQPITNHIPKPLMPVLGRPVLQSVLERVSALSVDKIGINLYHKKDLIERWVKNSDFDDKVQLFHEESILGTGGAIKNAEAFLGNCTFLVHNSDILSDIDLAKLLETHHSSKNLVTLAVHDYPEFNCLDLDEKGYLKDIVKIGNRFTPLENSGQRPFLMGFTGIAVYSPKFMKYLPLGASGVVDAWLYAIADNQRIGILDVTGCYWNDIGTPSAYSSAVFDALKAEAETLYVHPSVQGCQDVRLQGLVVIEEENTLKKGMSLKNCILLPGSRMEGGTHYEDCILGPGIKIDLAISGPGERSLIGTGGSDRKYYRIKKDKKTAVLMQCARNDPDFERQIEYTRFFLDHSVPVPELMEINRENMSAVFEDLGDLSLYSWLKCPRGKKQMEEIYKNIIDILILIHTITAEHIADCQPLQERIFDQEHFLWETAYFMERFVKGIRKKGVKNPFVLQKELQCLALKADSFRKTIIHRDFQSQNIMITDNAVPCLIDYQGARIGPPAYDVVSILWDPYVRLEDSMREGFINYYISKRKDIEGEGFMEEEFRGTLISCRLQRHMQALGAYGFLSAVKAKKYFLKYVPEGLRLLKQDLSVSGDGYPVLRELVMEL